MITAHGKKYQPMASKCSFQLPSIRNFTIYCPSQRTHSCCPPTNLHTLNPAREWAKSTQNMPAGETMHDVSFESVKSHFRQRIRPHNLSRCKGGLGEDAETKWLFLEDPLLPDEAKSFSPFVQMALMDTEDN